MSMGEVMESDFVCGNDQCHKVIEIGEVALRC